MVKLMEYIAGRREILKKYHPTVYRYDGSYRWFIPTLHMRFVLFTELLDGSGSAFIEYENGAFVTAVFSSYQWMLADARRKVGFKRLTEIEVTPTQVCLVLFPETW